VKWTLIVFALIVVIGIVTVVVELATRGNSAVKPTAVTGKSTEI
jgi:hypothetical protein